MSDDSEARAAGARRTLRLLSIFLLLSLVTHGLLLVAPPLSDEAAHLVGSGTLLRGDRLYVDFVDNKPPLLYVFYAGAQLLLGRGLFAVRLVLLVVILPLTAWAVSAYYRHARRGMMAAVLYLSCGAMFGPEDALAVNTELLMLLPAAGAFVAMRSLARWRPAALVAGLMLGIASLFKVTAVFWLPAIPWFVWRETDSRGGLQTASRSALEAVTGVAISWLGVLAWTVAAGNTAEMIDWVVLHNFGYVTAPIGLREAVIRALRGAPAWALVTLPLWWAVWRTWVGRRSEPGSALAAVLTLLAVPAVFLGFRFFGHYYLQVLLPLCLAAAPEAERLIDSSRWSPATRTSVGGLMAAFAICFAGSLWLFARNDVLEGSRPIFRNVTERLRQDACAGSGTLFVWGVAPLFYAFSDMQPATRFVLPQETISGYVPGRSADVTAAPWPLSAAGRDWHLLFEDLERTRATFILDTSPAGLHFWRRYPLQRFPAFARYVQRHYVRLADVDDVVIYRRRDCERSRAG